jgi:hypothetical protein
MTGVTFNGTLDRYYDGTRADMWVEYKAWPSMPRDGTICVKPKPNVKKQPQGRLSPNQLRWATRRWNTGKNAAVVVVLPNRMALILKTPVQWTNSVPIAGAVSIEEVARWITDYCGA